MLSETETKLGQLGLILTLRPCVCVCVCVREREREREMEGGREGEGEKDARGCTFPTKSSRNSGILSDLH